MEPNIQTSQSRTLITIIAIALIVVAGGVIWFMFADRDDNFDFEGSTTTRPNTTDSRPVVGQSQNIIVYAPRMNERIGTPVVVEGEARVFENVVNYRLVDANGKELAEGFTSADAPDIGQFGAFRGELNYASNVDQKGTVEIFWYSAKDGSEVDKVTIPVTITKTPEFIKG